MTTDELTPRQGKVLRFIVGRTNIGQAPVPSADAVVLTPWSDLPKTEAQAQATLMQLVVYKLVKRGKHGYSATAKGVKLIAVANKKNVWQKAPPAAITNNPRSI